MDYLIQETIDRISTNEHDKGDGDLRRVICCAGDDSNEPLEPRMAEADGITHDKLVEIARNWLASRSPVSISEISSGAGESPDCIAFCVSVKNRQSHVGFGSVLIECKVTKSDFNADKNKYYRRCEDRGMGDYRFYMAPKGLLAVDKIPHKWGLLEVDDNGKVKMVRVAERQEADKNKEIALLISTLRRLKIDDGAHVSIKKYTYETKNKACLVINARQDAEPDKTRHCI
jgi:hypothetical protein